MGAYRTPMTHALNEALHDEVKGLYAVLVVRGLDDKQAKARFATGLTRARAAYEDALDAIATATADEE
jgi:hypothetical protein